MKKVIFLAIIAFACDQKQGLIVSVSETTAIEQIKRDEKNASNQLSKPYVILVSIDGFRYDYAEHYNAQNLLNFDVKAEKMIPSFPSKTFPNHYAIVTGLYPGNHGLVSNAFYDRDLDFTYTIGNRKMVKNPSFYKGTPLWVLASQQKMVSANFFWVGSEAPIKGILPTYHYKYDGKISHEDRVNQVITWLQLPAEARPHFIGLYFSTIDDLGHKYGPNSKEIAKGVAEIDNTIGDLVAKINELNLPVNIIVVSDHGMINVNTEELIHLEEIFPPDIHYTSNFPAMVYDEDPVRIDSLYKSLLKDSIHYNVYLKNGLPKWYHYEKNLNRIGDLVLMPKSPYTFYNKDYKLTKGESTHGYDPKFTPEMGAVFYAKGPAFTNKTIPAFENVHIYPLIAHILGLAYNKDSIDGSKDVLLPILK
jgi:predicted AlkP superfamily pyrophosphatase or phosphodiesterase